MRPINSDFSMPDLDQRLSNCPDVRQAALSTAWIGDAGFQRGRPRMLRTLIWPLAFAAMNDAGAVAFRAWPHVESVSDVAATAIVTDHAWPQNLDSADACEPITLESASPQRTLRSAPTPENRRGASYGTVTTLRPPLGDAHTNAAANVCFWGDKADMAR